MLPSKVVGDRYEVVDLVRIADPSGTPGYFASDSFDESEHIRDRAAFHRWEREQG